MACNEKVESPNVIQHAKAKLVSDSIISIIKLPTNGFSCGILDSRGTLWFGSNGGGVYYFDGHVLLSYREENGFCDNAVQTIFEDQSGTIWFGTSKGLCKYDGNNFSNIELPFQDTSSVWLDKVYPIINPNAVHSIAQDLEGNLWIGTGGGGAYRYDGQEFTAFLKDIGDLQEDSLYHNWIPSITIDSSGFLWFGSLTHGGASKLEGNTFKHFMPEDGLSDDMVRKIYTDRKGNVLFGFNGNRKSGLTIYDGAEFRSYTLEDGLCNSNLSSIFQDNKGNYWLGSGRGKLCIFTGNRFYEFKSEDGQTFEVITFIVEGADRTIWFGGSNGLWQYDGSSVKTISSNRY